MKWYWSSLYRYCMRFSSKSTSSTFSPARNVLSMTRPSRMCLSLVRTKAPPFPGLTCWKSTMVYGAPSNWILSPFLNSAVETCIELWPLPSLCLDSERLVEPLPSPCVARILPKEAHEDLRRLVHQALREADTAEALSHERLLGEEPPEGRPFGGRTGAVQHLEHD